MSLYHEAAALLTSPGGGCLKSRVFGAKNLKSPTAQVYALALETCKWSSVLKEVIENAQILQHERKLTPVLALLLTHDLLLAKGGVALPASHGLRAAVERHKARLASEFTRVRVRRKMPTVEALRAHVEEAVSADAGHPRWVRINTLKTSLAEQLDTTFSHLARAASVLDVAKRASGRIYVDEHVPNLVAISPGSDITKTGAYKSGAVILQDKASCFPAYLLDPRPELGAVIDACAAPGNKTTHVAAVLAERTAAAGSGHPPQVYAFEKDSRRAEILERMVKIAGADSFTTINKAYDFLKADPDSDMYKGVGALLLDPSCSGSGIVGRDDAPELHLPDPAEGKGAAKGKRPRHQDDQDPGRPKGKKRRPGPQVYGDENGEKDDKEKADSDSAAERTLVDDEGETTIASSAADLAARLAALAAFQAALVEHAMRFPGARRITYSTCSVHAEENEHVVLAVLRRNRAWRILPRADQVDGMRRWPVRGDPAACPGRPEVADACIRAHKGDRHGVMGFFVAAFVRCTAEAAGPDRNNRGLQPDDEPADVPAEPGDDDQDSEWSGCSD